MAAGWGETKTSDKACSPPPHHLDAGPGSQEPLLGGASEAEGR